ncbi:MAG: MFS transporter [Rhodobacteraceae bacterium]|nr:MFS transporter [Paracoccaceae bacterium]
MLAMAGLPIYIHAPKVYAETWGISLGLLGAVLFGLRLFDLVQDPALGWLVARLGRARGAAMAAATAVMALAMAGLFAVTPPIAPVLWFALTLALLFTAYSFLTIAFYARGVARGAAMGPGGDLRLAGWREGGALAGVCLAAMAPGLLGTFSQTPYAAFAALFALTCALAALAMRAEWHGPAAVAPTGFRAVLRDPVARGLLALALVNAAPLAVTSTLFLFFVESRLEAAGWEGPLLILFFLSAAAAAPAWARAARQRPARPVLLVAMVLSILSFGVAATLGPGDLVAFAIVCMVSGVMLGADMVILPALFSRRLAAIAPDAGTGFGMWSFATKFTLAFAAAILLPVLQASGFRTGADNPADALRTLTVLYALVPCALKLAAIALLMVTRLPED